MRKLFMTGYPGFIGRELLKRIKDEYDEVHALVEERFYNYALKLPESDGIQLHVGDITRENLGLEHKLKGITHAVHLAAIYDLSVDKETAYKVNVEGTRNVMKFLEGQDKLNHITYISTAYVSGDRTDVVKEDELDKGQSFKNYYEESKFWAEMVVVNDFKHLPTAILRPAIVVGDSEIGITHKFDGPYFVMEAILKLPKWIPLPLLGNPEVKPNIVPVNHVVDAISKAMLMELKGTYHLTDPNPSGLHEIYKSILRLLKRKVLNSFSISIKLFGLALNLPPLKGSIPKEVLPYFEIHALYDCTNAINDLKWNPPNFLEYMDVIVNYFLKGRVYETV